MANLKLKNPAGGSLNFVSADGASDLTVTFPATTGTAMVSGNMPAFSAYPSGTQSISTGTYTKILFQTETFDTNNNFASSTFTPTVAGYYQVNATIYCAGSNTTYARGFIYKNGSALKAVGVQTSTAGYAMQLAEVISMNGSTDYLDVYCFLGAADTANSPYGSSFSATLVRSA
jgi:hypothetical protein